jgi:hypothetical protein
VNVAVNMSLNVSVHMAVNLLACSCCYMILSLLCVTCFLYDLFIYEFFFSYNIYIYTLVNRTKAIDKQPFVFVCPYHLEGRVLATLSK